MSHARAHRGCAPIAVVVSLAIVAVFAADASAQRRRGRPTPAQQAQEHFYQATLLYEEGNHEGAIVEFEASYELDPRAVVRLNVAQCYRSLSRYDEAVREYRRYLAEAAGVVSAERRAQVEGTIAELERLVAPIRFEIEPAGAALRVDGRDAGDAPVGEPLRLSAGRHAIEISADGFETLHEDLVVVAGRAGTVRVRLAEVDQSGTLRVDSVPEHAEIRIDGLTVGPAPVERPVSRGGHVVEAELDGFALYRQAIEIAPRQVLDLRAILAEEEGPPITARWWFWAGASALAVGATVLIWALAPPVEEDPVRGNVDPPIVRALRSP